MLLLQRKRSGRPQFFAPGFGRFFPPRDNAIDIAQMFAQILGGKQPERIAMEKPAVALMPLAAMPLAHNFNADAAIARFSQIIRDCFIDFLPIARIGKPVVHAKPVFKLQIVRPQPCFFPHLPERRPKAPLPFLKLALGEIPILPAVIEQQKFRPLPRHAVNDNSG